MSAPARTCRGGGEGGGGTPKQEPTLKQKNPPPLWPGGQGKISWHWPWPWVSKQNLITVHNFLACSSCPHLSNVKLVPDDPTVTSWLILTRICLALSTLDRSGTTDHVLHTATVRDTFLRCSIMSKHHYFDFK